jgi:NTP pyrophosphatase (non-canonical NTP hydrolase)
MSIELRQKELLDWQIKNFGLDETTDLKCTIGMCEELGELSHFILKTKQKIREGFNSDCKAEIADAFGDIFIYGIQLMTTRGIDAEEAIKTTIETVLKRNWKDNPISDKVLNEPLDYKS